MKKPTLKNGKFLKRAGIIGSAILVSGGLIFSPIINLGANTPTEDAATKTISLSSNESVSALANMYGVTDYLCRSEEDNSFVRFEPQPNTPINVIVDEDSVWCMTEENIQAIKNSIDMYNDFFKKINPNYKFRYISKKDFDTNYKDTQGDHPFIFISSLLRLPHECGTARAVTSAMKPVESKQGNGQVSTNATMLLSSTDLSRLTVPEITTVVNHEMAHALGFEEHVDNESSVMNNVLSGDPIRSNIFSADMSYALASLYYNKETSPYSLQEINEYIENMDAQRKMEIKQSIEDEKTNAFTKHLNNFISNKNISIINPNSIIGKKFTYTSMYGQITTIELSQDGTYLITITQDKNTITAKGSYYYDGNIIICDGDTIQLVNGKLTKVKDPTLISAFSDGTIAISNYSKNGTISTVLNEQAHIQTPELAS